MIMKNEDEKYQKILEILRKSRPRLSDESEMADEVIRRIREVKNKESIIDILIDSLFGWVYLDWVRRGLVGASILLISVFVYQQACILKQVKDISRQVVVSGNEGASVFSSEPDKRLTLYKMTAPFSTGSDLKISETELKEIMNSYYELQGKYSNLLRIIEENPDLKELIEQRLNDEKNCVPDL